MANSIKGFTVTLKQDIRDDDFQRILEAVEMINGVGHVEPSITTHDDHMNRTMIKLELRKNLLDLIKIP